MLKYVLYKNNKYYGGNPMTRREKIKIIRDQIRKNVYPREFEPYLNSANCYAYALGCTFNDNSKGDDYIFNIGSISLHLCLETAEEAKNAFLADMEILGIKCRESNWNEKLNTDEWKVALFFNELPLANKSQFKNDFHFIRQDLNKSWSHQKGVKGIIQRVKGDPSIASAYKFVGCFALKVIK